MIRNLFIIGLILSISSCLTDDFFSPSEQLAKDIQSIDSYLTNNGIAAIKDASGIRIAITQPGTGIVPPNAENFIRVKYTGKLFSNGSTFDSGTITGKLTDYIVGWQIGLSLLTEGAIATLYIPSGYAYGNRAAGSIPANSILVFNVELESVTQTTAQINRLQNDVVAIDNYLDANEIEATQHESGIRFALISDGESGISPGLYDQVKVSFKGKLLSDGSVFFNEIVEPSKDFSCRVANFPHGLIIGLQLMKEGDKAIFYVPSTLAYGPQSNPNIPSNSNVIFEIELISIL